MGQETRKDPRAKVLTMTVRYKSATVDEFIEHHSHDVSRGGIFIKTPSPFPAGTLLKFEIKIADDSAVLQGVGRVVWKRDAAAVSDESPAGMGVKFIKIDEPSRQMIDKLVVNKPIDAAPSAYDAQPEGAAAAAIAKPAAQGATSAAKAAMPVRKATMMGLGAIKMPEAPAKADAAATVEPARFDGGGFFPSSGAAEQPPPAERTVYKQAAELLQEALREAGGSLGEVGENPLFEGAKAKTTPPSATTSARPVAQTSPPPHAETAPPPEAAHASAAPPATTSAPPRAASEPPHEPSPEDATAAVAALIEKELHKAPIAAAEAAHDEAANAPTKSDSPKAVAAAPSRPPAEARRARSIPPPPAPEAGKGSGGRVLVYAGVIAIAAVGVYLVTKSPPVPPPPTPAAVATESAPPPASTPPAIVSTPPAASASAPPVTSASAAPSAAAPSSGKVKPDAAPVDKPKPVDAPPVDKPKPEKPKPVDAPPVEKPKPVDAPPVEKPKPPPPPKKSDDNPY